MAVTHHPLPAERAVFWYGCNLLRHGANAAASGKSGWSALMEATGGGHEPIARLLLGHAWEYILTQEASPAREESEQQPT